MDLSIDEAETLIHQIVCGGKFSRVEKGRGGSLLLFIGHPHAQDLLQAEFVKMEALAFAEKEGLPSIKDIEKILLERKIWTPEKDAEVKNLEDSIKAQRVVLAKTTRVPANRDRLKKIIKDLEDKLWDLRKEKEVKLEMSRERKAEEERVLFLAWCGTFLTDTTTRYWKTYEDYKNETDFVLRRNAAIIFAIFLAGTPHKTLRALARHTQWRIRYLAAQKNGGNLFHRGVSDYTIDMLNLMYWSGFYSSIYEMMPDDKPEDIIIEDDDALDAYMEDYFKEQSRKNADARSKKTQYGNTTAWNHEETIVTKNNPMFKDIEYSETLAEKLRKKGASTATDASVESLNKTK